MSDSRSSLSTRRTAVTLGYAGFTLAVYHIAPPSQRLAGLCGAAAAVASGAVLLADYHVQLAVIPPSLAVGEADAPASSWPDTA